MAKHFEEALRIHQQKDARKYRNLLDNPRFALEQLLKDVLRNRKPIEKQNDVLLPWLAARGAHKQTVNLYSDFLARFTQYQNDAFPNCPSFRMTCRRRMDCLRSCERDDSRPKVTES